MSNAPPEDPSAVMNEPIRSFRPLIDQALIAQPQLVSDILTASIQGFGGHNNIAIPTEIIAQRAVGILCLTLKHMQDPDALFEEFNPDTGGVQGGELASAIPATKGA